MRWLELLFTKNIEIQYKKKLCDAGYLFHIMVGLLFEKFVYHNSCLDDSLNRLAR